MNILRPQAGKQELFLSSPADIAIYGGAAGGGKTYALLLENARHSNNGDFGSIVFRRNSTQIMNEGGLWDTATQIYTQLGAEPIQSPRPMIRFKSGAKITFAHLQYDKNVYDYQGSQIPLICFDELTHFTEFQFFYMLSRNRSTCGVTPYIRATCNPDSESWVRKFLDWWIDDDGYAIEERCGVLRYFFKLDGEIIWADTAKELMEQYNLQSAEVKSATFISSSVYDNQILLDANPQYLGSLKALSAVEQGRLLHGNWNIRPSAGLYFKPEMARIVDAIPDKLVSIARAWDLAGTEITAENTDPDRTAGVLMARMRNGQYIVLDVRHGAFDVNAVRQLVLNTANQDRTIYKVNTVHLPQDPGQAGKDQARSYTRMLAGFYVKTKPVTGSKITRAEPFSAQWQAGNVYLLKGDWNDKFIRELEGFPDIVHDDMVDATSDAFNQVALNGDWGGLIN